MTKKEARNYVKNIKKSLDKDVIHRDSNTIIAKLCSIDRYNDADDILCYVSYNQEVDTHKFIERSIADGKKVYVPAVDGENMEFYMIDGMSDLSEGAYGILEPIKNPDKMFCGEQALMIMPGLAFDRKRNRVGYGGGFYDRYLEHKPEIQKVAICFDFQIIDELVTESYDLKPDVIISTTEIIYD